MNIHRTNELPEPATSEAPADQPAGDPPNPGDPGPELPSRREPVDPESDPKIPPHPSPPVRGV